MKNKLPYIFIFDIDNCIIGNIEYPLYEYELYNLIKKNSKKNEIIKKKKYINFINILNKGLLRPYFKEFINFIKKKYKNVEIYVYTNSSYSWTYGGLVYNIEKSANIKFNKPFFTRENSNLNLSKSLKNVFKIILNKLKKKYPLLNYKKNISKTFNNNIIFIDNIKDNLADYPNKQLTCPEYNFSKYYNVIKKIKKKYNMEKNILNNNKIKNYIKLNNKNKKILSNYIKKKKNKDIFFKKLISIIKKEKIDNFNDINIKFLNKQFNNF